MDKWQGKTAVVTGAGMGIGARISYDLAANGMNVVGFDFTDEKIADIDRASKRSELVGKGKLTSYKCDIRSDEEVIAAFNYVDSNFDGVDVLINNAGVGYEGFFCDLDINLIRDTLDTNLMGAIYCTRQAVASLRKRGTPGHIIMMNSISGHYIPHFEKPGFNMYTVSKHALTTFAEALRLEFRYLKLNIKVTNLSPGIVNTTLLKKQTEILVNGDFFSTKPILSVGDVSEALLNILRSASHVQIHEVLLRPLHEEF